MTAQRPQTRSNRPLAFGLGAAGLAGIVCLCLGALVVGGIIFFRLRQPPPEEPAVAYILDASARMSLSADQDHTRLAVAQAVLAEVIRPADPSSVSGLRVFGSGASTDTCKDTHLVVPFAPANQPNIVAELPTLTIGPTSDTPLAEAMVQAIRDLAQTKGPHSLVVVTGGSDSCNPDAGQLIAQEAARAGIKLETFVVGFMVDETESQAIKGIIDQTPGGMYLGAPDENTLRNVLRAVQAHVDDPATTSLAQVMAIAKATPLPVSSATQIVLPPTTDTPEPPYSPEPPFPDLNGVWVDNGHETVLVQSGYSVVATFIEERMCDHRDGKGTVTPYPYNFVATLKKEGDLWRLSGQTISCYYGESNPNGTGPKPAALELVLSEDQSTLTGDWHNDFTGNWEIGAVTITRKFVNGAPAPTPPGYTPPTLAP